MQVVGLNLSSEKTEIRDTEDGFCFLGFYLKGKEVRLPRKENIEKLKLAIEELTPRARIPVADMLKSINDHALGWYNYYKLSTDPQPFIELDELIRKRLGHKLRGRAAKSELRELEPTSRKVFSLSKSYADGKPQYDIL